jgi:uncharacterized membrane protein
MNVKRIPAARLVSRASHVAHGLRVGARDLRHRARGIFAVANAATTRHGVDDDVLVARVRSRIGHACAHPHAIRVTAHAGNVVLAGPVDEDAERVLHVARTTFGVAHVVDRLERHAARDDVAGLRGTPKGGRRTLGRLTPAGRLLVGGAGALAMLAGVARGGLRGLAVALAGGAALARSIVDAPLAEWLGPHARPPAIDVSKTITIHAPPEHIFDLLAEPETFPRFMRHVKEVRHVGENRWHWKVVGPLGIAFEWDAYTERLIPNELLAWRTAEGATVAHEGSARLERVAPGTTRVSIRLRYWPPAGILGHDVARLLGADPKSELDCDMLRLKTLLEKGKTTGPHGTVSLDDVRLS